MSKITVTIEWDEPKDKQWLNVFNIEHCLKKECQNTNFVVTEIDTKDVRQDELHSMMKYVEERLKELGK